MTTDRHPTMSNLRCRSSERSVATKIRSHSVSGSVDELRPQAEQHQSLQLSLPRRPACRSVEVRPSRAICWPDRNFETECQRKSLNNLNQQVAPLKSGGKSRETVQDTVSGYVQANPCLVFHAAPKIRPLMRHLVKLDEPVALRPSDSISRHHQQTTPIRPFRGGDRSVESASRVMTSGHIAGLLGDHVVPRSVAWP